MQVWRHIFSQHAVLWLLYSIACRARVYATSMTSVYLSVRLNDVERWWILIIWCNKKGKWAHAKINRRPVYLKHAEAKMGRNIPRVWKMWSIALRRHPTARISQHLLSVLVLSLMKRNNCCCWENFLFKNCRRSLAFGSLYNGGWRLISGWYSAKWSVTRV